MQLCAQTAALQPRKPTTESKHTAQTKPIQSTHPGQPMNHDLNLHLQA